MHNFYDQLKKKQQFHLLYHQLNYVNIHEVGKMIKELYEIEQ